MKSDCRGRKPKEAWLLVGERESLEGAHGVVTWAGRLCFGCASFLLGSYGFCRVNFQEGSAVRLKPSVARLLRV